MKAEIRWRRAAIGDVTQEDVALTLLDGQKLNHIKNTTQMLCGPKT